MQSMSLIFKDSQTFQKGPVSRGLYHGAWLQPEGQVAYITFRLGLGLNDVNQTSLITFWASSGYCQKEMNFLKTYHSS
jgi:hypothetical protein